MKVNSTGLGKTTLTAHISGLAPGDEPGLLVMKIESTEPVHWYITCRMEPADIRAAMKMVLKPAALIRIMRMALGLTKKESEIEGIVEAEQNG
jgi:energy-coupling factor transporter ATP-binding protein EcfA2